MKVEQSCRCIVQEELIIIKHSVPLYFITSQFYSLSIHKFLNFDLKDGRKLYCKSFKSKENFMNVSLSDSFILLLFPTLFLFEPMNK